MKRVTSGNDYEKWCAAQLSRHGFHQISLTKASGDQGVDIIAYKHHFKYGIQCKFYDTPVGNSSVQEAYAGAAFYGCDKAAVMTNTVFTRGAEQLAKETEVLLWPQKDPAAEDRFLRFYRILRTIEIIAGACLFFYTVFDPALSGRLYVTVCALFLMLAGAIGMFTMQAIVWNILADLSDTASILCILYLIHHGSWVNLPWYAGNGILLCISLFQLIMLWRSRNAHLDELAQKQNEADLLHQAEIIGSNACTFLQQELGCDIQMLESRMDGTILVFVYHADQKVDVKLPEAEKELNQKAQDNQLNDLWQITDLGRRKFQVSLQHVQK